jgi:hypothetical protein
MLASSQFDIDSSGGILGPTPVLEGCTVAENSDLQFDQAQFDEAPSQATCKVCGALLHGSYFEANGHTVCEACSYTLREGGQGGSRMGRVLRSIGAGVGAAFAGTLLYWGILAVSGYEFGLIAIVVGYAVGKAVHWGSRGRGGWAYQALAMALTYLAIVSAYVPQILTELMKPRPTASGEATPGGGQPAADAVASAPGTQVTPPKQPAAADPTVTDAPATEPAAARVRPGVARLLFGLALVLLIACAAPFLSGVQNVFGLVIIGIGVYEAWKLNRHVPLVITGPYALATRDVAAAGR